MKKICPSCEEEFDTIFPSKIEAMNMPVFTQDESVNKHNRTGREEFISGLCAKCQNDLYSFSEEEDESD